MPEIPPEIDTSSPHPARMYDYMIGGKDNFAADREAVERVAAAVPGARIASRENRAFLGRAVRFLAAEAGVRQFLDIGSGLPTASNVHEIAQRSAPDSRVVYADNDPLVLAHARALLRSSPEGRAAYIQADLRNPEAILDAPATRDTLDFTQPVALILASVLHFIPDADNPQEIVKTLLGALAPGSFLAASHVTSEHIPAGNASAGEQPYQEAQIPLQARESDVFAQLAFSGLELVSPGVVLVSEWRPDQPGPRPLPSEVNMYGGVAKKL